MVDSVCLTSIHVPVRWLKKARQFKLIPCIPAELSISAVRKTTSAIGDPAVSPTQRQNSWRIST